MSQKCVEIVIGGLATDEALRARFFADPSATLEQLREAGFELLLLPRIVGSCASNPAPLLAL